MAIIGILAAIGIPQLLGSREKARAAACDALFHALDGELSNELDNIIHNGVTSCGDQGTGWNDYEVISCAMLKHGGEDNPRNRSEKAFVGMPFEPVPLNTCQVGINEHPAGGAAWGLAVMIYQQPEPASPLRTFSIYIE